MIDFVGKRFWFYLFSLVLIILPGLISLVLPNGLRNGIEFSSGSTFTARFAQPVNEEDLRTALEQLGHPGARVQKTTNDRIVVRTDLIEGSPQTPPIGAAPPSEREELETALEQRFSPLLDGDGNAQPPLPRVLRPSRPRCRPTSGARRRWPSSSPRSRS